MGDPRHPQPRRRPHLGHDDPAHVHTFNPGSYDMGYPVATQLADGSIVCSFYGYSTPDAGEQMPHGMFVSVFDEKWLTGD